MKAKRDQVVRALKAPGATRLFLLHGDEGGSRALADMLAAAMGLEAERIDLAPGTLKGDPARLADEAAAGSLFGGARWIRVEGAGEECVAAAAALMEAPAAGNPVAMIAGSLKPTSALRKLVEDSPLAISCQSWEPSAADMTQLAMELGRQAGLRIDRDVAARLAAAAGAERAVLAAEIDKLALYLDAAPERPAELDHAALDLLSADTGEADLSRMVAAAAGGDVGALAAELARLAALGIDGVGLVRAMQRRLLQLAELRGQVEDGNSIATVVGNPRSGVWKSAQADVSRELGRWTAARLAGAIGHVAGAGREAMSGRGPGVRAVDMALDAVARQAARGR